jgi:hypothetical protein
MEIIKEMLISEISLNNDGPRQWGWKFPQLIDMDQYYEDRFKCTEDRYPYSRLMYREGLRERFFKMAVQRVEQNDEEEMRQFKPIIIDEYGMLISGFRILQIYKIAGKKSVEVAQVYGLKMSEKMELMMADSENFGHFNWTPKLPRMRHKKVLNYKDN